ncbi:hypothetical protein N0M98_32545 [Paenibacillus doosanensis]|uniref:hypothetical protein n=1 Tax=Paenibacillus doosanensis TaxID=1229154 RepID=UPI00217F5417|nr:hypothetical protein [Paenibacillus doosanensis]MCS7464813.1 hypothetical protein [Paenibacillus doosanensis]
MKQKAVMIIVSGLLCMSAVGCQQAQQATAGKPQAQAAGAEAKKPESQAGAANGKITQEEAGIKIRVDIPEIKPFLQEAKQGPVVPALMQKAVPQGIGFIDEKNWILVSHYRENGLPSLLTVIDAATGSMIKVLELYKDADKPYTGHAGGVTVSRSHVWISSDNDIYRLKLEDIVQAGSEGKLTFGGSIHTETRASFTTYGDGVLWAGEFAGKDYPTEKSHYMTNRDDKEYKAWAVGYKLDEQTDDLPAGKSKDDGKPVTPDYILSLPDSVQGMAVLKNKILLSQSSGRNAASSLIQHANVLSEKPHTQAAIGSESVPVWFLDSKNKQETKPVPPMSEGIVYSQGTLYMLFESGASMYKQSSSYALDRIQMLKMNE